MFKMSSFNNTAGNKYARLMTLVIGFSAFFSPILPLTQPTVMAQDSYEKIESDAANSVNNFEKEYIKPVTAALTSTVSTSSASLTGETLRGRGNGGGTTPPLGTPQWTVAATPGVKISVDHQGWYRVSADQLQAAGFNVNTSTTNWQLFSDAVEQSIKVNADNSIEFYGRELDTPQTNTRVYFLMNGQTAGKRISVGLSKPGDSNTAQNFDITVERKPKRHYLPSILNGDAENWFGSVYSFTQTVNESVSVFNPDTSGTARLSVKLQGATAGQHTTNVKFNNLDLGNASYVDYQNMVFEFDVPMSAVVAGLNQVSLRSAVSDADYGLVDTISLTYKRLYQARNNRLHFSMPARKSLRVGDFTESAINVFELQNGMVTAELSTTPVSNGSNYGFTLGASKNDREMIAVTNSQKESPLAVEANAPSTWNNSTNNADYLILAPAMFGQQAQTLANMRIQQGLNTKVVLTEDVFDEFSFGARSSQAIRDFLRHATLNWQVKPKYVVLFGDSSFDQRGYYSNSTRNIIPAKMVDTIFYETSSDSWYTDFNNDTVEDIAIGRLPAGNQAEATQMVDKLARYDAQGDRQVKKGVFVADALFSEYSQQLAGILPNTAQSAVINRSDMTDSEMQQAIFAQGSDNPLLVVYTGHGSQIGWMNSSLLSTSNVGNLGNSQLGFYMIVGCLNGYSHDPYNNSLAEALLKTPNGAMGVFASSGSIAVTGPTAMSPVLTDKVFNSQPNNRLRIGDILILSKQNSTDADSKRTYQLFGDPTVYIK